jgi:hypothetical protein
MDNGHTPLRRRRVFRLLRRLTIAAILIIAIAISVNWTRANWPLLRLYWLQRECIVHPISPGIQVYSSAQPANALHSQELNAFLNEFPRQVYGSYAPPPTNPIAVYLGTRQATNGRSRFIAIYATVDVTSDKGSDKATDVYLFGINRPIGLAPLEVYDQNFHLAQGDWLGTTYLTGARPGVLINSGVEDPNDKSHFTIEFDCEELHTIVNCYLKPDGTLSYKQQNIEWSVAPDGTRIQLQLNSRPGDIYGGDLAPPRQ